MLGDVMPQTSLRGSPKPGRCRPDGTPGHEHYQAD